MSLRSLMLIACVFVVVLPTHAQAPREKIDSLLEQATLALGRYQQLASGVHCDEAVGQSLRDSCNEGVEMLGQRVQEAKDKIARYRQLPAPAAADLFDVYELFHRLMEGIEIAQGPPDYYGKHNEEAFAAIYNNFVKVTGWFGGVVRDEIQNHKCP
jgi:hypothetical protein